MKALLLLLLLILLLLLSTSAAATGAADILSEARKLHQQAIELQGGWADTEKLLKQTQQLLSQGKEQAARDLAQKAHGMASRSLDSVKTQNASWSEPAYLR